MDFQFEYNMEGVEKLTEQGLNAAKRALELAAEEVWGNLRRYSPVDTGRLSGSWALNRRGDFEHVISTDVEYAEAQQTGVEGPIKPTSASCLKFYWDVVGNMTVWKGDLGSAQEMASFASWAKSLGFTPIFAWPQGFPPHKPDGSTPYVDYCIDRAEQRTQEFVQRALNEVM